MRTFKLTTVAALLLAASACDYSGDWLFATSVPGVPGVIHLGEITPATVNTASQADSNAIYGEVGPTGTPEPGGVTFTFTGTGGDVCLWVDPELIYWNQAVAATGRRERYSYPDNVYDDGDLDLYAGLAAYYNGSPGEKIGDFVVRYQDSLGNPVNVDINECTIPTALASTGGHAGRGAPEHCTLHNTETGVSYLVLLQSWSVPLDDSVLSYGLLVTNGSCDTLQQKVLPIAEQTVPGQECLIEGESTIENAPGAPGPWYGASNVPSRPGSTDFEETFCNPNADLAAFCQDEAATKDCTDPASRCFCGNPNDTPKSGAY